MTPAARSTKPDAVLSAAVETARAVLLEAVAADEVGEYLGFEPDGERVGTHYFAATRAGYRGWRWSVTVARGSRLRHATVDEIVLLPGTDSLVAPDWVPWKERIEPGDLGPGDLLPTEEGDPRLVPGYLAGDEIVDQDTVREVTDEIGMGRERVLSLEGRDAAAERWYGGDQGPDAPIAQAAPASCGSCGYLVRIAGPLGLMFGVCANESSPDDARVVSFDHGCGAHSQIGVARKRAVRLPEPALDTLGYDDVEAF